MRRAVAATCALVFALALIGCARQSVSKEEPESSSRAVAAGSQVALANGLSLTVPESWTATLTTYSVPSGDLQSTEYLLLENHDAVDGPKTLMVFTSLADTVSAATLGDYGHDTFTQNAATDSLQLFVGRPGTPYEPKRLMAGVTQIPDASTGVLYFAGDPTDPLAAFEDIRVLFSVKGL